VNKQCPSCGTPFNLGPQDDGKRFSCFKCSSSLLVTRTGLQLAAPGAPSAIGVDPLPSASLAGQRPTAGAFRTLGKLADGPTWCFAVGAFLVIVFLFFPLINRAKVERAKALVDAGKHKVERMEREIKQKGKDVSISDEERFRKVKESWVRDKENLEDDAREIELDSQRSDYLYTWGMMLGFLFLAAAALGYLNPAQPAIRRVVGAIVIVAEVLLIFMKYIFRSSI
jgi:hypothetical protein